MVYDGHEDGRVRALAQACFKNGQIAKMLVVPRLPGIGDFQGMVGSVGFDDGFIAGAKIAL